MVVNELNGEKIDIVPFSDDLEEFVMKALAPAKVTEVRIDYNTGTATVIVPDYQLSLAMSLAIGKEGQNARLAHRLVGLRVDIVSETQMAENEANAPAADWAEGEWITDEETGEQKWQPADGGPALTVEEWNQGGPGAAEADDAVAPDDIPAPDPEVDPDAAADVAAEGLDDPEDPDVEAAELGASDSPEAAIEADEAVEAETDTDEGGGAA
jgi:N utilization substance protein A